MTGFAGILTHKSAVPDEAALTRMEAVLGCRGKSAARYATSGFAMVRVSSAPEAIFGSGESGSVLVEVDGAVAREDVSALYGSDGTGFAASIRKTFSLMLYDGAARQLVLARDRFGTHPLYYAETEEGLIFASGTDVLLASGLLPRRMDRGACEELVQLQFTCGARTPLNGINRVLPGETLVAVSGKLVERLRRDLLGARRDSPHSDEDALQGFERLFHRSVEAAVEGATSISLIYGGEIEGTVLMAATRVLFDGDINIFIPHLTTEPGMKALERAKKHAGLLGLEVQSVPVTEEDFWRDLPGLVAALDDPVADYMGCYLYRAAEVAAGSVANTPGHKVLVASGADEIFAGRSRYRSVLRPLWFGGKAMRARGFMEDLGLLYDESATWRDGITVVQSRLAAENITVLQRAQALDAADFLPNDVLVLQDRILACHGLDHAFPFLDEGVAEYGFWLEDRFKIAHGLGKSLLRQYLARRFPGIDWNKRYRWPSVPVRRWMSHRDHDLGALVAYTPGVTAISPPDAVENLFLQLQDQPAKRTGNAAWQLMIFALWYKIHIEERSAEGSVFDILAG